jgi:hypothetical protein
MKGTKVFFNLLRRQSAHEINAIQTIKTWVWLFFTSGSLPQ